MSRSARSKLKSSKSCGKKQRGLFHLLERLSEPPEDLSPDAWGGKYVIFPQESAEPGPLDPYLTPYTIAFQRAAQNPIHRHVMAIIAAQAGKTVAVFNIIGHGHDTNPKPTIYVGPTRQNLSDIISPKFQTILENCERLWAKTLKGKKLTRFRKVIGGAPLRFVHGGSTSAMKSDSARRVVIDEVDEFPLSIKGQGNIWLLADARHKSFVDGQTIGISTPGNGHVATYVDKRTGLEHWEPVTAQDLDRLPSVAWRAWQNGSRHEFMWPCAECGEYFAPRYILRSLPPDPTPRTAATKGGVTCPHCGAILQDDVKRWMNLHAVMVAPGQRPLPCQDGDTQAHLVDYTAGPVDNPKPGDERVFPIEFGDYRMPLERDTDDASFWVSGWCHYQTTIAQLCAESVRAEQSGDVEALRGVINQGFAECFRFAGEAPTWKQVEALTRPYAMGEVYGELIDPFFVLTVDKQHRKLVYVVRAWDEDGRSALVEHGELHGNYNTDDPEVWEELDNLIDSYHRKNLSVSLCCIDSSDKPDKVYDFARDRKPWCLPVKGESIYYKPWAIRPVDVNHRGKVIKNGVMLLTWNTGNTKSNVMGAIYRGQADYEGQPSQWWLPDGIDEDYCRQLVSESRLPDGSWKKTALTICLTVSRCK